MKKVLKVESNELTLKNYSSDFKIVEVTVKNPDGIISYEAIPYSDISSRRTGLPIPQSYLSEDGLLRKDVPLPVVKLYFARGYRFALNEKEFDDSFSNEEESEDIKLLKHDMVSGELKDVEFKASFIYPPSKEDPNDHAFQTRELIKQCQGFANSKDHKGHIWIGVQDKNNTRTIVGIQGEFKEFSPKATPELYRCYFMNTLKQMTSESLLLATNFSYVEYQGKTLIKLDVNYHGDVVFFGRTRELNVRIDSSMHRIDEVSSYIDFIRNFRS